MSKSEIPDTLEAQRQHVGPHHLTRGILYMLASGIFSSLIWFIAQILVSKTSLPIIVAARNAGGLIFTLPWMIYHGRVAYKAANFKLLFLRSLSGTTSTFLIFSAVGSISLTSASLLINTSPFFVPLIFRIWKQTPINHKLWLPIMIGFLGIIFVLQPTVHIFHQIGSLSGLASGISFAISTALIRMATKSEKMHTTNFYFYLISLILTIPFLPFGWHMDSLQILIPLGMIGLFSGIGQSLLFKSLQYGKASQISPFGYSAVIYSVIIDYLFNHIVPSPLEIIGIVLICAGGVWLTRRAR